MPQIPYTPTIGALRRLVVGALAYAVAVALIATGAAAMVPMLPAEKLFPGPPPVVARVPVVTPATGPAPKLGVAS